MLTLPQHPVGYSRLALIFLAGILVAILHTLSLTLQFEMPQELVRVRCDDPILDMCFVGFGKHLLPDHNVSFVEKAAF